MSLYLARELEHLNACRLFLRVLMLSDLVSPAGTKIKTRALTGTSRNDSSLEWPRQGRLSAHAWTLWQAFLKKCFSPRSQRSHHLTKPLILEQRLGSCLLTLRHSRLTHGYDPALRKLYSRQGHGTYVSQKRHLHHRPIFEEQSYPDTIPSLALPVEVWDHGLLELRAEPQLLAEPAEPFPTSFMQFLSQLPYHKQRVMGRISLSLDEGEKLADALWRGNLDVNFVSNGSVRAERAGHAWVVICDAVGTRVDGAGPCDANPDTVDSFRAEYMGLLAMGYFFRALRTYYNVPNHMRSTLRCDNKTALKRATDRSLVYGANLCMRAEFDLEWELKLVEENLGLKFDFAHVKGHMDNDNVYENILRPV